MIERKVSVAMQADVRRGNVEFQEEEEEGNHASLPDDSYKEILFRTVFGF